MKIGIWFAILAKFHNITANFAKFSAKTGDVILDAALLHGIEFPHDCRAGRCGSCLAKVMRGVTLGGHAPRRGMIHACQARALSDLDLQFDLQPPVQSVNGYVASLVLRGSEVTEVGLKLVQPIDYLPGQYCKFKFRGFPMRSFSPTLPADGSATSNDVTLHVKKVRGGLVSNALGQAIQVGHKLRVEGPFGAAYYRQDTEQRLILVAGGTGFAPILSILMAALEDPNSKPIVLIIGARNLHALYMASNLINFHKKQDLELIVTTTERSNYAIIRYGTPLDFVPELRSTDGIYAAGSPKMVTRLAEMANKVDANFYADPFESSSTKTSNWLLRGLSWCGRLAAA